MVQRGDDEIILLKIVNSIFAAHQSHQVKSDAVGARIIQRKNAFAIAGDDPRAINAQARSFLYQPELHRVPIEPRQFMQRAKAQRPQPTFAIGHHIIGKHRISQHWHMAEHVMENVRFLQIVNLVWRADKIACGETAVGEMIKEHIIRYQPRHRNNLPPRRRHQSRVELDIIGNARLFEFQHVNPAQKRLGSSAR